MPQLRLFKNVPIRLQASIPSPIFPRCLSSLLYLIKWYRW